MKPITDKRAKTGGVAFRQHPNHERFENAVTQAQKQRHYPGGWKPSTNKYQPHSGSKQQSKDALRATPVGGKKQLARTGGTNDQ